MNVLMRVFLYLCAQRKSVFKSLVQQKIGNNFSLKTQINGPTCFLILCFNLNADSYYNICTSYIKKEKYVSISFPFQ